MHGRADENHGFNPLRLQRRHVKKHVSTHAESNCPAFEDAEMIQQSERIQRTLAVGDRPGRICGPAVTTRVGFDERVFTRKLVASGMGPVFQAAGAAVKKHERLSCAFSFVIHFNAVQRNALACHGGIIGGEHVKKQSGKYA